MSDRRPGTVAADRYQAKRVGGDGVPAPKASRAARALSGMAERLPALTRSARTLDRHR
ncbi:hypothetical protein [Streptomyces leeuwenhoekii]|uniref:hypothetical protein n=1 Tax=Streptomyces leeuwenhoekii TaxID=1437453 RepID=UPI001411EC0A|nr:hypothetical protein [Streptomyces leeuwenhoekii]